LDTENGITKEADSASRDQRLLLYINLTDKLTLLLLR